MNKLQLTTSGNRQIVVTRQFSAAPELVYRAHTEEALIRKWMLGPPGWRMTACRCDARPSGSFRYDWTNDDRGSFYITGEFVELVPFSKISHVERMYLPAQTPDNRVETRFEPIGSGTLMTITMTLPDESTRAKMLDSGMEHGMEDSYARLEAEFARGRHYAIVDVAPQLTAAVPTVAAFPDLQTAEQTGRQTIAKVLPTLAVTPGLTCTLFRMLDGGRLHYEPGVIVDGQFDPLGGLTCSELPGGRAVRFTLVGSFDKLPEAWPALFSWCQQNGIKREGTCWQIYGPAASNPDQQETTLYALIS